MSNKLYEKCNICDGTGSVGDPPGALTDERYECPCCRGEKYADIGLTVGQLERMRAELARFKAGAKA
jgi:excinuclease UvrABC ATPase subunit